MFEKQHVGHSGTEGISPHSINKTIPNVRGIPKNKDQDTCKTEAAKLALQ